MGLLADFLDRYKKITPPDDFIKEKVSGIIKDCLNIEIQKDEIRVINGVVFIKTNPHFKNVIFIKKHFLLSKLKEELGDKSPRDFR